MGLLKFGVVCLSLTMVLCMSSIKAHESEFMEVTGKELKAILDDSINHSLISYWFIGELDNYFYIVEKRPYDIDKKYKINKKFVSLGRHQSFEFTTDEKKWLNLKKGDLLFN